MQKRLEIKDLTVPHQIGNSRECSHDVMCLLHKSVVLYCPHCNDFATNIFNKNLLKEAACSFIFTIKIFDQKGCSCISQSWINLRSPFTPCTTQKPQQFTQLNTTLKRNLFCSRILDLHVSKIQLIVFHQYESSHGFAVSAFLYSHLKSCDHT